MSIDMEDRSQTVDVPKSAAALLSSDRNALEDALNDELSRLIYELIDSNVADEDESVEVQSIEITPTGAEGLILFSYTHLVPSGCSDLPFRKSGSYSMRIVMRFGDPTANLEDLSKDWDASDFGSRNDGA